MKVKFWMTDGSLHVASNVNDMRFAAMMDLLDRESTGDKRIEVEDAHLMVRHIVRFKVEK